MNTKSQKLSRREREIMDILIASREATAQEIRDRLPDPPSNSAVRAMLARLEKKRVIRHFERDLRYVYVPLISREKAQDSALAKLVTVFFDGSIGSAVTGLVEQSGNQLSDKELDQLESLIQQAKCRRSKP